MTVDSRLPGGTLVDVVTHVSEIVYLEPPRTLVVLCHPASARLISRWGRRPTHLRPPESAHPDAVGSWLAAP